MYKNKNISFIVYKYYDYMGCYFCGEEEIINLDCFLFIIFWLVCIIFLYCCFKICIIKNII